MPRSAPISSRLTASSIDGILISLPNFGDEKGVAETLKLAGLQVPVLVQAYPDDPGRFDLASRRRRLLRQDLSLQQPAAVSRTLLADRSTHAAPTDARVSWPSSSGSWGSARW